MRRAIPFPYPSTYFRNPLTFLPRPGFLENRSTGSSALSWLTRQAEHHSNPRWNPRETPSRPLIAFSSFDVVRFQIWAALRADAADPGYIYIYTRGCNPPPTSYFLRPNSSKSWYQSDWIFVDDLGRIERDRVWGSGKAYHARAYAILLSRTPINERNREPPLLERVIQIDDQFFFPPVSFSFFLSFSLLSRVLFSLVKFHLELSVMCSFNGFDRRVSPVHGDLF